MSLDITPVITDQRLMIRSYGDGRFNINDYRVTGSVLLYDQTVDPWSISDSDEISLESLSPLLDRAADYEIILIGCGERSKMPPNGLKEALKEAGLIMEWMNSGAAARTYNVLQTEDRKVLAAIIAI